MVKESHEKLFLVKSNVNDYKYRLSDDEKQSIKLEKKRKIKSNRSFNGIINLGEYIKYNPQQKMFYFGFINRKNKLLNFKSSINEF